MKIRIERERMNSRKRKMQSKKENIVPKNEKNERDSQESK